MKYQRHRQNSIKKCKQIVNCEEMGYLSPQEMNAESKVPRFNFLLLQIKNQIGCGFIKSCKSVIMVGGNFNRSIIQHTNSFRRFMCRLNSLLLGLSQWSSVSTFGLQ